GAPLPEQRAQPPVGLARELLGSPVQHEQPARGPEAEHRPDLAPAGELRNEDRRRRITAREHGGPHQETRRHDRNESTSEAPTSRRSAGFDTAAHAADT